MNTIKGLFEEYAFQNLATQILESSLEQKKIAPAYLFTGPSGVGQKEIALRFLEGITKAESSEDNTRSLLESGNHPDLYLIEPTYLHQGKLIAKSIAKEENLIKTVKPQIRLDQIKDLKIFLSKKPIRSKLSMIIIDDVDTINESASNALLKTIEEPITGIIILLSSRPEKLLDTIKSRCQKIPFKPYTSQILKENFNISFGEKFNDNAEEIIYISNGSPEVLKNNMENLSVIPENIWNKINYINNQSPIDALLLAKEITSELDLAQQSLLIIWMQEHYWRKTMSPKIIKRLDKLREHLNSYINPRIAWEIALINLIKLE